MAIDVSSDITEFVKCGTAKSGEGESIIFDDTRLRPIMFDQGCRVHVATKHDVRSCRHVILRAGLGIGSTHENFH